MLGSETVTHHGSVNCYLSWVSVPGNVANLLLVRAEARQKEVAIRTAMGAGRADLAWSFLTESVTLALVGGAMGAVLAFGGMRLLHALGPSSLPRLSELNVDATALAFAATVSLVSGVLFGLIPVLRYGAPRTGAVLRDGSRGSTGGRERHRVRSALVVLQTAFALMLLIGSGLMVRTFHQLTKVDPGFDGANVLTLRLAPPPSAYGTPEERASFYHQALDRIGALPGVESVGAISQLPLTGAGSWDPLSIEDQLPESAGGLPPIAPVAVVDPGFFETLRIPLLRGRMLERRDVTTRSGAVLVSRTLVDQFFPDEDPIGKRLAHGMPDEVTRSTVVGVVGDVHQESLSRPPYGIVYYAITPVEGTNLDYSTGVLSYTIRTSGGIEGLLPAIRREIAGLDPNLAISGIRFIDEVLAGATAQVSFTMIMPAIAAFMGLALGAVGIYGVVSYVTSQRTRAIGVRMALGAGAAQVRTMVMRESALVTATGLTVGVLGSFGLTRFLEAMLFGITPTDPVTFASVTVALLGVSLLATYVPARRAAGTDPMEALRQE